jgi:site-specific DNA-methyltransferase (adenine-specific)
VGSYKESGHPAEKPEKLVRRIITTSSVDGIVLDPFLGSGTTAVAAKNAGLRCIGIEAEERYCEIAAKRLGQEVLDFGAAS